MCRGTAMPQVMMIDTAGIALSRMPTRPMRPALVATMRKATAARRREACAEVATLCLERRRSLLAIRGR